MPPRLGLSVKGSVSGQGISVSGSWLDVTAPGGWGWTLPITIQRKGAAFRAKGFDITTLKPAATKTYYVSKTGNDSNSGADWDNAKKKILTVLGYGDADCIYIGAGVWDHSDGPAGVAITRSCSIIGVGDVTLSGHQPGLSWTLTSGKTYTYQVTRSATIDVLDAATLTAYGDYTRYVNVASIDAVEATAGTWYTASNVVYVHTSDNRAPDANILVMLTGYNIDINGDVTVYLENLKINGGTTPLRQRSTAGSTPKLYAKNCEFNYSSNSTGNGVTVQGADVAIFQGCTSKCNRADGFNFHAYNSVVPKAILIDCIGRDNGPSESAETSNGFTVHDAGYMVVIGGTACRNKGPNVVPSDAYAWCMGTLAYSSVASSDTQKVDYESASTLSLWLDSCLDTGSSSTYALYAGSGTTIYTHINKTTGATAGSGTITTY